MQTQAQFSPGQVCAHSLVEYRLCGWRWAQVQVCGTTIWQTGATVPLDCCLMWVYWQVDLVQNGPTNQEVGDDSISRNYFTRGQKARQHRSLVYISVLNSIVFLFVFLYWYWYFCYRYKFHLFPLILLFIVVSLFLYLTSAGLGICCSSFHIFSTRFVRDFFVLNILYIVFLYCFLSFGL